MNQLIIYEQPAEAVASGDYNIYVREPSGEWQSLFVFEAKVDMHHVRSASMAYFDMEGAVEIRVVPNWTPIQSAVIRPLAAQVDSQHNEQCLTFRLDRPRKLSIEINGERFRNLHLFAGPVERDPILPEDPGVVVLGPGRHGREELEAHWAAASQSSEGARLYVAPGRHDFEGGYLDIPSGATLYTAGGAVLCGSLRCSGASQVTIRGRGVIDMGSLAKETYLRAIELTDSSHVEVEGVIVLDPPHYSIYLGQSTHIQIHNFKAFSTRGWCDGIDMMACEHVDIRDVFLRTSDDCIAIYGSRKDHYGDTRHVSVTEAVLWADVAHAIHVGIHGDHEGNGDTVEHLRFENIDVLEHHEPQENYWGALAICAGDNNVVRHVVFHDIRVEEFELGQLFDIRVVWNEKYNPVPGRRIEHIVFSEISYNGALPHPSRIWGYDAERTVSDIRFSSVTINGEPLNEASSGFLAINAHAHSLTFT